MYGSKDIKKNKDENKDENKDKCPPELYVAMSRAKKQLILVVDEKKDPLPFLKLSEIEMKNCSYINFEGEACHKESKDKTVDYHSVDCVSLIKFIKPNYLSILSNYINNLFVSIQDPSGHDKINLKNVVEMDYTHEEVFDINGEIIIAKFEQEVLNRTPYIHKYVNKKLNEPKIDNDLKKEIQSIPKKCKNIKDYLHLGVVYVSLKSGYKYKIKQINKYKWCSEKLATQLLNNLSTVIYEKDNNDYIVEYDLKCELKHKIFGDIRINGRLDLITDNDVFELKCAKELSLQHKLQLTIYCWMWNIINPSIPKEFKLFNYRTCEMFKIIYDKDVINEIIDLLIKNKYDIIHDVSNEVFIDYCRSPYTNNDHAKDKLKTYAINNQSNINMDVQKCYYDNVIINNNTNLNTIKNTSYINKDIQNNSLENIKTSVINNNCIQNKSINNSVDNINTSDINNNTINKIKNTHNINTIDTTHNNNNNNINNSIDNTHINNNNSIDNTHINNNNSIDNTHINNTIENKYTKYSFCRNTPNLPNTKIIIASNIKESTTSSDDDLILNYNYHLNKKSAKELKKLCKNKNIKKYSKLNKSELISLLST